MRIPWLKRGFLIFISLGSLYASSWNLVATRELGSIVEDPVAEWQARFEAIKDQIPFQRGVVGYISDASVPGIEYDAANEEGEYVLTQYAMAPIIIVKGTDYEWNIGNLSSQGYETWSAENAGTFEAIPLKGGLYLLHRIGN